MNPYDDHDSYVSSDGTLWRRSGPSRRTGRWEEYDDHGRIVRLDEPPIKRSKPQPGAAVQKLYADVEEVCQRGRIET